MARVVVVGGGIAGLAAAHRLAAREDGTEVVLLEADDRVGGKLRHAEVAGVTVDVGAEAMLARRPEGVDLARAVGLDVVHPALASSRIWTRGALRPLPRSLMGVPLDLEQLEAAGILTPDELARVRAEATLGAEAVETGEDITVGDLVDRRLGPAVTDLLVEPLLGGVYAGHARLLSARAAVPQLLAFAARGSLLEQAAAIPTTYDRPVFAGLEGGMALLPAALQADLVARGVRVVTGTAARTLHHDAGGGFVVGTDAGTEPADAVVVALPPAAAGRLLEAVAPTVARELAAVVTASVAVVTFAFDADDVGAAGLEGSGFLVPPVEERRIKASTFSYAKWDWVGAAGAAAPVGPVALLRTSLGRAGDGALERDDASLVADSRHDLAAAVGLRAEPRGVHVQRWPDGLPQYGLGHLDRVRRIRSGLARVPGLAVAGAAYDGVGVPAVIGSSYTAVESVAPVLDNGAHERRG
ncbi:protoporphyrinogen oxidase [Nocardioides zeae]|uniref:Coproporphyrinogen III oxidase n=1 Tax=Nocardioides imazamoxiresistens TaxID=3231893 RepID=A0ABU3PZS1_9ACTN|nr:protoporphyrinogen oxidase [Nocardioides zeae]MDT9594366.1 protoporphyrinogen oxidase [Nocardioides zeae]